MVCAHTPKAPPPPGREAAADRDEAWEVWWCLDAWHEPRLILERLLVQRAPWARLHLASSQQPLAEQVGNASVLIPTTGLVDAAAVAASPRLRLIAQPAAGTANIDVAAAKARGVPVTYAPGYNDQSTAEVALLLMLMLAKRAVEAMAAVAARAPVGEPVGHELRGKTLGIVGMGRVGARLAAAAAGLGMQVVSTTSASSRAELEALLASSDVVSLHCQLTPQTAGLVGAAELALLKPGALLVNTARGAVVDKGALWQALQDGKLGGVGLDVAWQEPADPADPLIAHPKVLVLPHIGCAAHETYAALAEVLCENIVRVREGRELLHRLC